ncbi:MAG: hypothetical protein KJN90_10150, partial [Gammaproteobacteria bacterium]|nr:hypothetical protein [Gammaproteobacteria bacterium]
MAIKLPRFLTGSLISERSLRLPGATALLLLVTGCSNLNPMNWFPDDEGEQPAELQEISQEADLERIWSVNVGNGQGGKYNELEPAVDGDRI